MGLKQVKSVAFDQLLLLVHVKGCTCATLVAKQQNGLKTSKKWCFWTTFVVSARKTMHLC